MAGEADRSLLKVPPAGGEYYVFRDAVHNLIEIDDETEGRYLRAILDTREVQRLRRIKQNGLGALVYPSLEGSRFPHALGAFYVARKIIRHLKANEPKPKEGFPESLRIPPRTQIAFPLAALLHDIGHGPLSHTWEEVFHWDHESARCSIIRDPSTKLNELLSRPSQVDPHFESYDGIIDEIASLYERKHHLQFLFSLISGHLDVDRLDFITRDTRAAGVTYGFHDLEWIIRSLRFARIPAYVLANGEISASCWVVAIDGRKGLETLIQFLRARESMYSLVYHHKTTRAALCLLRKIFTRVEELLGADVPVHAPTETLLSWLKGNHTPSILMQLEDDDVLSAIKLWANSSDSILSTLSQKFLERKLYKVVEVSPDVAELLQTIDAKSFGHHLLKGVESTLHEEASKSAPTEREYRYGFDRTDFDVIGDPSKHDQESIWIIRSGRYGLEYVPLRVFWTKQFGTEGLTSEHHYVHCFNAAIAEAVQDYVTRLPKFSAEQRAIDAAEVPPFKPIRLISQSGANKEVYLGVNQEPGSRAGTLVAMKYYKDAPDVHRDLEQPNLRLENANSRHITLASGHNSGSGQYVLVENCWHASLEDLVIQNGLRRDLEEILDIGAQLFEGLKVLHERGIRHTDIKLDNCGYYFDAGSRIYTIGDFGCMSVKPSELPISKTLQGTKRTIAPERLEPKPKIGLASDVWALGMTIYSMCSGHYWFMPITSPHQGDNPTDEQQRTLGEAQARVRADVRAAVQSFRETAKSKLPPLLWRILKPAFADFENRGTANVLAEAFERSLYRLRADKDKVTIKTLWCQFEDLSTLSENGSVKEQLRRLHPKFQDYIPESST